MPIRILFLVMGFLLVPQTWASDPLVDEINRMSGTTLTEPPEKPLAELSPAEWDRVKTHKIIGLLAHKKYSVRELATKQLQKRLPEILKLVGELKVKYPDPEV